MKSTSAFIPGLERMNGIQLEDNIASRLSQLRGGGQVKDFYYQPVMRYFDQDIHPDFVVEVPRSNGLEIDVIEAKDWGQSKAFTLYSGNIVCLVCQDERIEAQEIITQMYRYDLGIQYDRALRLFRKGTLILVTTAPLYIAEKSEPPKETPVLRIPVTTRSMNSEMQMRLSRSNIYAVSFAYFEDNYPNMA
jgi:hypothetical protein